MAGIDRGHATRAFLGPLCFLVYIHDLPNVHQIVTHKYIDDTTLTQIIDSGEDDIMNSALTTITDWSHQNFMKINAKKTKEMVTHMRKKSLNIEPLTMNSSEIERVHHFKILGIWVDDKLTWDQHIHKLMAKLSQRIYYLKQLKRSGVSDVDLMLYYKAVIRSTAEYGCQVWNSGLTKKQCGNLEQQKSEPYA